MATRRGRPPKHLSGETAKIIEGVCQRHGVTRAQLEDTLGMYPGQLSMIAGTNLQLAQSELDRLENAGKEFSERGKWCDD